MLCAELALKVANAEASGSDPAMSTLLCAALPSCFAGRALKLARVLACSSRCILRRQGTCVDSSTLGLTHGQ